MHDRRRLHQSLGPGSVLLNSTDERWARDLAQLSAAQHRPLLDLLWQCVMRHVGVLERKSNCVAMQRPAAAAGAAGGPGAGGGRLGRGDVRRRHAGRHLGAQRHLRRRPPVRLSPAHKHAPSHTPCAPVTGPGIVRCYRLATTAGSTSLTSKLNARRRAAELRSVAATGGVWMQEADGGDAVDARAGGGRLDRARAPQLR